ncbi:penicillin-binding protein 1C [Massilia rhizosphaerae]|uniref:penicillin-binding protein 1C n=1 Tax=Massilia rhizosphaerae TaxID=2784389 RepID=UPI0018DC4058|nr:penicillin-binding protein 1C [Massilia rhizosphaerae]
MKARLVWILLLAAAPAFAAVPTPQQVRAAWRSSDTTLLDRHGATIAAVRVDMTGRRLPWVALDDISPTLGRAVLQAEDQRFMEHGGIDLQAIGKAAWDNLFGQAGTRTRGASTITMQLAGMLDPKLAPRSKGRTWESKWDQALAARELEAGWNKRQILEAYLNLASYRGELQGVGAAAYGLFGKAPSGLDAGEAAILASLLRAPTAPARTVAHRACLLARELDPHADCGAIEWEVDAAFSRAAPPASAPVSAATGITPQFVRRLGAGPGTVVRSTLDAGLQRYAAAALHRHLAELAGRNVGDGAVIVIDNASGEVLAYVANDGEGEVDGVTALRQAGSTLKPFLYELALERGQLTAASLLDDTPVTIPTVGGLYVPQNYDHQYRDAASVRTSLAGSLNVPAVRTLMLAGLERFHERLRLLGITSLTEAPEFYGWSLALGSGDVSLLELTGAYRTLANGGLQDGVTFVPRARAPKRRVLDARATFIVADILSDRAARSTTFGLTNELATGFWSAVKTGTSKDMRDNWCVGFSDRYTVGVWVGNFDGGSMWDVSGVSGAAPVWRDVMDYLHRDRPSRAPAPPPGLVRQTVWFEPAVEPERSEWFVRGTETAVVAMLPPSRRVPRIVYPAADSVIALDPDIPPPLQRVSLRAYGGAGLHWQLDGADAGPADQAATWAPRQGKHELELVGDDGRAVAAARFEVRGAEASGQPASTFSTSSGGSAGKSSGSGVNSGESER